MADPFYGSSRPPRRWQAAAWGPTVEAMRRGKRPLLAVATGAGKSYLMGALCRHAVERSRGRAVVVVAPRLHLVGQLAATMREWCGVESVGVYTGEAREPDRAVVVCSGRSLGQLADHYRSAGRSVAHLMLDEAHGSEAAGVREVVPLLDPASLMGLTGTPFRSLPRELLSVFSEIAYRYTLQDGTRDGVLVPLRVERYRGHAPGTVDEETMALMAVYAQGPGIVSASTMADADAYADYLSGHGWAARSIHSGHGDREARIAALESGDVRALVHVSLLAEGVDLPWLRWLALRRLTRARVRFVQEIGRVLRAHPGKREGLVLDPHCLLGRHGLESTEALGRALEAIADGETVEGSVRREVQREAEVLALDELTDFLAELLQGMRLAGLAGEPWSDGWGDYWRMASVSKKQVDQLARASRLTRHVPEPHRAPLRSLLRVPWALTRGDAADLLSVLWASSRWSRGHRERHGLRPDRAYQWPAGSVEGVVLPTAAQVRTVRLMRPLEE